VGQAERSHRVVHQGGRDRPRDDFIDAAGPWARIYFTEGSPTRRSIIFRRVIEIKPELLCRAPGPCAQTRRKAYGLAEQATRPAYRTRCSTLLPNYLLQKPDDARARLIIRSASSARWRRDERYEKDTKPCAQPRETAGHALTPAACTLRIRETRRALEALRQASLTAGLQDFGLGSENDDPTLTPPRAANRSSCAMLQRPRGVAAGELTRPGYVARRNLRPLPALQHA